MMINRRGILTSLFAAPAIIAIDRLMPVKALAETGYVFPNERISPGEFIKVYDAIAEKVLPGRWELIKTKKYMKVSWVDATGKQFDPWEKSAEIDRKWKIHDVTKAC